MSLLRSRPPKTLILIGTICIGFFVDSAIFLLLLLSSSAQDVSWWVTAVVLANLIPPIVLAPALGWLVDRTSGRFVWAITLAISGLCASGIAFLDSPIWLVVLAAVQATCAVAISASVFKLLPLAQSMDERSASSFAVGIGSVAAIGAPPLAAMAVTLGNDVAFWICGGLLLLASITVLRSAPKKVHVKVERTAWHEVWVGTRSLRTMTTLKAFLPMILGVVIVTSMEGVAGVFYLQQVAGSAVGYALLLSAWAAGSLAGAILAGRRSFTMQAATCILVGGLAVSAAIFIEGLIASALVIAAAFLGGGMGNAIHNIGVRNLVYEAVPRAQQAQVWSVVGALFSAAAAFGNFLGTPGLIGSARITIVVAGATGMLLAVATLIATRNNRQRPVKASGERNVAGENAPHP